MRDRLVVGISGSSGVVYGVRMLEVLKGLDVFEVHLVLSSSAVQNLRYETELSGEEVMAMADVVHDPGDLAAGPSSGSFKTRGMVVIPCSIKTLSGIANSYNDNLLTRAADVTLKEKRKLVVVPRETPLHKGHLELMMRVVDHGAVLLPPMPSFYHRPKTITDIVDQTIGKVLDQFDVEHNLFRRWKSDG